MEENRQSWGLTGGLLVMSVAIVAGVIALIGGQSAPVSITLNPPAPTGTPAPTATFAPIVVYVTGAVGAPETLVSLPYGSRVEDAINGAGGFTEDADRVSVNLAGILRDGDQIHVGRLSTSSDVPTLATPMGGGTIALNSATQAELETLQGIGAVTAERIIAYRERVGRFNSLEELDNVEGIGSATIERLRPFLRLD